MSTTRPAWDTIGWWTRPGSESWSTLGRLGYELAPAWISSICYQPVLEAMSTLPEAKPSYLPEPSGVSAWLEGLLLPGVPKLGTLAPLAAPMKNILRRQAVDLCLREEPPDAPLQSLSPFIEAEINRLKRDPAVAATLDLPLLLQLYAQLAVQAGWLSSGHALRFADPLLPALLVGSEIAQGHKRAAELRKKMGADRGWAEGAFAAVALGDPIEGWTQLLLQEEDPLNFIERIFLTCHALGATAADAPVSEEMTRAFHLGIAALIWLFPRKTRKDTGDPSIQEEEKNPLYLSFEAWSRCTYRLAHSVVSRRAGKQAFDPAHSVALPPPLDRILDALGLVQRLSPDEARAVAGFCSPFSGAAAGQIDQAFFQIIGTVGSRFRGTVPEMGRAWMHELAIPALITASPDRAPLLLAGAGHGNVGVWLLGHRPLNQDWQAAWEKLLGSTDPAPAIPAWLEGLKYKLRRDWPEDEFLVKEAPERLRAAGLWPAARDALRQELRQMSGLSTILDDRFGEILRLAELTKAELEELAQGWDFASYFPLNAFLSAGVPFSALASGVKSRLAHFSNKERPEEQELRQSLLSMLEHGDGETLFRLVDPDPAPLLHVLENEPPGDWFQGLLRASQALPPQAKKVLLGRLATFSSHKGVRRACLKELLLP